MEPAPRPRSIANNVSTFTGGISNSRRLLSAASAAGIKLDTLVTFASGLTNSGTITASTSAGVGIVINAVSGFTGNISNSGTITAKTAIDIAGSTITGALVDNGKILGSSHGILIDSASTITSTKTAIAITGATFTGGITNAGTILGAARGIYLDPITTFGGGITSSGRSRSPAPPSSSMWSRLSLAISRTLGRSPPRPESTSPAQRSPARSSIAALSLVPVTAS